MTLGQLINRARVKKRWTLDFVVNALPPPHQGKSRQWLSNIENDKATPSASTLIHLHTVLVNLEERESNPLLTWLLAWATAKVWPDDKAALARLAEQESRLAGLAPDPADRKSSTQSLEYFPEAFQPLTVICGDRRESSPKSRGDLFAYSVSITDLTFLPQLGLPRDTRIRSDKLCVLLAPDTLRSLFGQTNLLIIGSPAVNFASRAANKHSLFRFNMSQELKLWEERSAKLRHLNAREHLRIFSKMAQNPQYIGTDPGTYNTQLPREEIFAIAEDVKDALGNHDLRSIMNQFRRSGFVDPIDERIHGQFTHEDNDFCAISIGKNPYADKNSDFVAITAAGIHGPGTAHAVKILGEKDRAIRFRQHPFGGVIEVQLNWAEQWADRLTNAAWQWQTKDYTPGDLLKNLERGLTGFENHSDPSAAPPLSNEEIANCIQLVRKLSCTPP
jgi:transcriptional regulator with XRE-family HTH domain